MNISDIKQILERKIQTLTEQRNFALQAGDLTEYNRLDAELNETQLTLNQL